MNSKTNLEDLVHSLREKAIPFKLVDNQIYSEIKNITGRTIKLHIEKWPSGNIRAHLSGSHTSATGWGESTVYVVDQFVFNYESIVATLN